MDVREKLVELLEERRMQASEVLGSMNKGFGAWYADHLIAHGVTVQEWISVKDRLPEQYHSVIVWTSDEELGEAAHDGKQFRWAYDDEYANVTHWMEMPQPPKGE